MSQNPIPLDWSGLDWHVALVRRDRLAADWLQWHGCKVLLVEGARAVRDRRGNGKRRLEPWLPFAGYVFFSGLAGATRALHDWHRPDVRLAFSCDLALQRRHGGAPLAPTRQGDDAPVVGLLGGNAGPWRVSPFAMQALFAMVDADAFRARSVRESVERTLRIGQEVAIMDGPFMGIAAMVRSFHSGDRLEIAAQLFGREVAMRVPLDTVAAI